MVTRRQEDCGWRVDWNGGDDLRSYREDKKKPSQLRLPRTRAIGEVSPCHPWWLEPTPLCRLSCSWEEQCAMHFSSELLRWGFNYIFTGMWKHRSDLLPSLWQLCLSGYGVPSITEMLFPLGTFVWPWRTSFLASLADSSEISLLLHLFWCFPF